MSSEELVTILDEIISLFDENLLVQYGIEKIKTMGDNYMCISGIDGNANHANNIVQAGKFLLKTMMVDIITKLLKCKS